MCNVPFVAFKVYQMSVYVCVFKFFMERTQDSVITVKLQEVVGRFPYVRVLNFADRKKRQLHAKVVTADRKTVVVGSANLSWGCMYSNYEVGLGQGRCCLETGRACRFTSRFSTEPVMSEISVCNTR
jgi:hypothetical protein